MFFRHALRRAGRPCWQVAVRGKKDLPVWRPPSFADFFRRDDPWFRDFWGPRSMDEFFRENARRMDALFRMSPWRILEAQAHGESADIIKAELGKDGLHLEINVSHFDPSDINVKMSGNLLVISGKHTSKQDEHGSVSREFTREFEVPEVIDEDSISCRLTNEGHLVILGKVKEELESGRDIPIERESSDKKENSDKPKEE